MFEVFSVLYSLNNNCNTNCRPDHRSLKKIKLKFLTKTSNVLVVTTLSYAEQLHNEYFNKCRGLIRPYLEESFKANLHLIEKCNELRYIIDILKTNELILKYRLREVTLHDFCSNITQQFLDRKKQGFWVYEYNNLIKSYT